MLNPLIHGHPADTLHAVYCLLDLLEAVPNDGPEGMLLDQNQVYGHFCLFHPGLLPIEPTAPFW